MASKRMIAVVSIVAASMSIATAARSSAQGNCSDVKWRNDHLSQCNSQHDEWSRYQNPAPGGSHGGGNGLLGLGIGPL